MKKNIALFCSLLFFCVSVFSQEKVELRIGILNGPSCVPVAYMMENNDFSSNVDVSFQKFPEPQSLFPKMIKSEIDIGFMPLNVAAKVYEAQHKSIVCVGICGNGNLSLITKDKSIKKVEDLDGKTVYIAGQGATPECIAKYVLSNTYNERNDEILKTVKLDYSIPTANLVASLISDKIEYAIVPEPFATIATTKDKSVFYALDMQNEYKKISGFETYPLTCIVVNAKYAKEHPEVVKEFLNLYSKSVDWTIQNPVLSGEYCQKNELGLQASIIKIAIPKSNYVFIPASESKKYVSDMYKTVKNSAPDLFVSSIIDDGFYLDLE